MRCLVNVRVLPMTEPEATSDAVAWHDGRIVALGKDAVAASRKAGVEPEDGHGALVLPGFVDAHMHFLHVGLKRTRPDLRGAGSKKEALARLTTWLAAHPGNTSVTGEGWDESDWDDAIFDRREIDAVSGDRPVVLRRICGHVAVANTAALGPLVARGGEPAGRIGPAQEAAKKSPGAQRGGQRAEPGSGTACPDAAQPDPQRLIDAETGLLLEDPSLYLNEVLPASSEELQAAVGHACRIAHALGVTTIGDYEQAPFRAALRQAATDGRLGVRIVCSIYRQDLEDAIADGFHTGRVHGPMFQDGGLKLFLDGSIGGHTARMMQPYHDAPGRGLQNLDDDELLSTIQRAHAAGIQVHAHAIGDGAIEQGLRAFETMAAEAAPGGAGQATAQGHLGDDGAGAGGRHLPSRMEVVLDGRLGVSAAGQFVGHRFEHFEIAQDNQLQRAARLGLWASMQPNFVGEWSAKGGLYEQRIGARFLLNNRFRSVLEAGIRLAFGSDGMPFGPLYGIRSATDHPDPEQRLDVREAVWHYTHEAAASLGAGRRGSLQPGHHADVLIIDGRLDEPATSWTIRETIVAGQTVHRSQGPVATDDDVP